MAIPEHVLAIIRRRVALDLWPASEEAVAAIARIVDLNLRAGRVKPWLASVRSEDRAGWEQYIDLIFEHWKAEHSRVSRLADRDSDEWQRLHHELTLHASSMQSHDKTLRAGCAPDDLAARACEKVYATRYPFDVAFTIWATNILVSVILENCTDAPTGL